MAASRVFSRREIEARIHSGDALVITSNNVLRLNNWQEVHPGGRLVIQHMVGRDATDELAISHSLEVLQSMSKHRIGRVEGIWKNFVPPIQDGVFRPLCETDDEGEDDEQTPLVSDDSSDEATASSDSEGRSYASSCTSVELDSVIEAAAIKSRLDGDVKTPRKLAMSRETYTATAVQEALDKDLLKYPSLDAATQRKITVRFRALHQRVHEEGFYQCRYIEYGKEMARYSTLFGLFLFCLHLEWYMASATCLGLFWQQIMFTAHDAGHRGITHNFVIDSLIGIFIGDFCCGLSIGWWKSSHNVHHFVTNDPVHDPDIQNVPLFATSAKYFGSIRSSYYDGFCFAWDAAADFMVKYQKYTYYPIMAIARFNLYFLSWSHLVSPRATTRGTAAWTRPAEIFSILCYITLFCYVLLYRNIPTWQDRAMFVFVSHLATMPLHIQITLSHWGTSTSDLGPSEAFAQRQLRTTLDVACPEWLDWIHGGLQFQAVHHLFPRVPRHNLRKLQGLVKEFCTETGIEYQILGFVDGNNHVLGRLQHITDQAKLLAACQAHMAATGESGLH